MSAVGSIVRAVRPVTDRLPFCAYNRMGFALNRAGFDPDDRGLDGAGRVAVLTGASAGIGRATSLALARRGFEVWMLCRDAARGAEAQDAVARESGSARVHLGLVDVSDLASIRRFVAGFPARRVDALIHNAGVLVHDRQLVAGVELTFATHVLGPYAMTGLLLDRLMRSSDARVVFVASGGLYLQRLDLSLLDVPASRFDGVRAYANAKRAQVVLARALADRLRDTPITFASMHPGWVDTGTLRTALPRFHGLMRPLLRTPEQGADTVVWLASSRAGAASPGAFWFDRRVAPPHLVPWTREAQGAPGDLVALCESLSGVAIEATHRRAA